VKELADYPNRGLGMPGYFAFLRERYEILLNRKRGLSQPWTADPVLQEWRFCNVRREDDKVTIWFRENIRGPLQEDPSVFFATVAFRWFNTIETGEAIRPWLLGPWDRKEVLAVLRKQLKAGKKLFTGAFVVNSKGGKRKHIDVLDNLDWVRKHLIPFHDSFPRTKESVFRYLLQVPRLGNFAAYQIVVDLQYTYLLRDATDLNTFTVAGPGCARGIGLMWEDDEKRFSFTSKKDQDDMLWIMQHALTCSRSERNWPKDWPPFVLSDIENGFCEYSKWRQGHAGSRLKRRFR